MRETFVEVGIIVRTVRSGDYDARIAIFTGSGIKWLTIKGVYRPKAKFSASIGLFTVAEFTINGQAITGINVLVSPYQITADLNRYYLACSIADALLNLEFVEQSPNALVNAIKAITELSQKETSCYVIFLDFYQNIYQLLGYQITIEYDPTKLTHSQGKILVKKMIDSFLINVDYQIQFCDMMY